MNLITLTQALRIQIVENYYKYKKEFSNDNVEDDFDDEEDIYDNEIENEDEFEDGDDEYTEELYSIYDEETISKVIDDIKSSEYKKLIHFIILSDCLEYIKAKTITKRFISNTERYLLILMENFDTKKLLKLLNQDDEFLLNVMTTFLEYNVIYTNEEKYVNRAMLKDRKIRLSKQLSLSILDDIQQLYDEEK